MPRYLDLFKSASNWLSKISLATYKQSEERPRSGLCEISALVSQGHFFSLAAGYKSR